MSRDEDVAALEAAIAHLPPELRAAAQIGEEVRLFLESDAGRTLLGFARIERRLAQAKLARVSPWRRRRIQQLQNEIRLASMFEEWIQTLHQRGVEAKHQLDALNDEMEEDYGDS